MAAFSAITSMLLWKSHNLSAHIVHLSSVFPFPPCCTCNVVCSPWTYRSLPLGLHLSLSEFALQAFRTDIRHCVRATVVPGLRPHTGAYSKVYSLQTLCGHIILILEIASLSDLLIVPWARSELSNCRFSYSGCMHSKVQQCVGCSFCSLHHPPPQFCAASRFEWPTP